MDNDIGNKDGHPPTNGESIVEQDTSIPSSLKRNSAALRHVDLDPIFTSRVSKKLKHNNELKIIGKERELKEDASSLSLWLLPPIIQTLGNNCGLEILKNLRLVNSDYYLSLHTIFWNKVNKSICLDIYKITNDRNYFKLIMDKCGSYKDKFKTLEIINIWTNWKQWSLGEEKQNSYWELDIARRFAIVNLIHGLSPYIQTLKIELKRSRYAADFSDPHSKEDTSDLLEFINLFPKLKHLIINVQALCVGKQVYEKLIEEISTLSLINKRTIKTLRFYNIYKEEWNGLVEKVGSPWNTIPNFNLVVETSDGNSNEDISRLAKKFKPDSSLSIFKSIRQPKLKIFLKKNLYSLNELKSLVPIVLLHNDIIESLEIVMDWFNLDEDWDIPIYAVTAKRSLSELSPFLTKLKLSDKFGANPWSVLDYDVEWSKLTELKIIGCTSPLEKVLRNAQLTKLYLHIDLDTALYMPSNAQLTDGDKFRLDQIFGNLKGLKEFKLISKCEKEDEAKVCEGSEFHHFIQEKLGFPKVFYLGTWTSEFFGNEHMF